MERRRPCIVAPRAHRRRETDEGERGSLRVMRLPADGEAFFMQRHRARVIALIRRDQPEMVQRGGDPRLILPDRAQRQALLMQRYRTGIVALIASDHPEVRERDRDKVR